MVIVLNLIKNHQAVSLLSGQNRFLNNLGVRLSRPHFALFGQKFTAVVGTL